MRWMGLILVMLLLTVPSFAAEVPRELEESLPRQAAEILDQVDVSDVTGFSSGIRQILEYLSRRTGAVLRNQIRGAVSVLLAAVLCAAVENLYQGSGGRFPVYCSMAGALTVAALTAGSLDSLIGLGSRTIEELNLFAKALLPTLAAATAATGSVTTATFQKVTTVFLVNLLLQLIDGLLMPLVHLYIGVLTAAGCLAEPRLTAIADGLKRSLTWVLTTSLLLFTLYLSAVRVISGAVDSAAIKVTRAAISGVVPVVGGIIADASETVLAGAGLLKNTIGIFGMLGILAACAYPFLQLGVQYLLYKMTAFLSSVMGASALCKLIDGLGGAFGLVLGMTGACALLLLVSVLTSVAAVIP